MSRQSLATSFFRRSNSGAGSGSGSGGATTIDQLSDVTASNPQIGDLICYTGSGWSNVNFVKEQITTEVANGTRLQFSLPVGTTYVSGTLQATVNGLIEEITELGGNTFSFSYAPEIGDAVRVSFLKLL